MTISPFVPPFLFFLYCLFSFPPSFPGERCPCPPYDTAPGCMSILSSSILWNPLPGLPIHPADRCTTFIFNQQHMDNIDPTIEPMYHRLFYRKYCPFLSCRSLSTWYLTTDIFNQSIKASYISYRDKLKNRCGCTSLWSDDVIFHEITEGINVCAIPSSIFLKQKYYFYSVFLKYLS